MLAPTVNAFAFFPEIRPVSVCLPEIFTEVCKTTAYSFGEAFLLLSRNRQSSVLWLKKCIETHRTIRNSNNKNIIA